MKLIDAQEMARACPGKFEVPGHTDLETIDTGHLVKVSNSHERFWVLVTRADGQGITGTINNALVGPVGKFGDELTFERRHVYQIYDRRPRLRPVGDKKIHKKRVGQGS